jgi:hypothetical protein
MKDGSMRRKPTKAPKPYTEPPAVRRKLADSYRKLANGKKYTPAERAEFARMADSWERTLPKKK